MWNFRGVRRTTQVKRKMQTIQPGLPYAVVTGGHICKALLPCGVIQEEVHLAEKRNVKRFPGRPFQIGFQCWSCRELWWTYYPGKQASCVASRPDTSCFSGTLGRLSLGLHQFISPTKATSCVSPHKVGKTPHFFCVRELLRKFNSNLPSIVQCFSCLQTLHWCKHVWKNGYHYCACGLCDQSHATSQAHPSNHTPNSCCKWKYLLFL